MTLENLVPPLEDCKRIPEGSFPESALVWEVYHYQYTVAPYVMSRETSESTRSAAAVESVFPAPTTDEILSQLPPGSVVGNDGDKFFAVGSVGREYIAKTAQTPATAALRLWERVKGVQG